MSSSSLLDCATSAITASLEPARIVHGVYSRYMEGKQSTEGVDMAGLKRGILQWLAQAEAAVERLEKRG